MFQLIQICILILTLCSDNTNAWDSEDLEVFDVVEEVGVNFYDLLNINQDASAFEIKKAFRKLSLIHHPDKSKEPDAEIKFRQLAAVYDILKDNAKRAKYHQVLEHGLPDWKHAVYYYRRVRKMGLMELSIILFIIVTIGQYLVAWASYFEKKYAIDEFISIKSKKMQKKQKKSKIDGSVEILPELVSISLPKPSVSCTLPVQICKLIWFLIIELPPLSYRWVKNYFEERKLRKELEALSREESEEEEEVVTPIRERGPRRRKGFTLPEVGPDEGEKKNGNLRKEKLNSTPAPPPTKQPPIVSGGFWTDDDFLELIRLMKKYPPGTSERWEKIGDIMWRPATEVAHMAHKMKDEGFKPITKEEDEPQVLEVEPKKVKTRKTTDEFEEGNWSQVQQKAFEAALAKYPKGASSDRWDKISKCVPGKTKEECMQRYKHLVDYIKKKKEKEPSFLPEDSNESPL